MKETLNKHDNEITITKATLKRINKHCFTSKKANAGIRSIESIDAIADVLFRCGVICGEAGHYEISDDKTRIRCCNDDIRLDSDYYSKLCYGMYTRWPRLIYAEITYGHRLVQIYDANTLVRNIVREEGYQ